MKFCKDGRILGQNNKEAGSHLGTLSNNYIDKKIKKGRPKIHYWRSGGEFKKGKEHPYYGKKRPEHAKFLKGRFAGPKSPMWEGGITPLSRKIRNSEEYQEWTKIVKRRDKNTCVECFKKGYKLHTHHIKTFSQIFSEFLTEYSQFSPIEDKETLLRIAFSYKPFWDIDNGITLCKKCHEKKKEKNYEHSKR